MVNEVVGCHATASSSGETDLFRSGFEARPGPRLLFGPGSRQRAGEVARGLGAERVLVVSDAGLEKAGHVDQLVRVLAAEGLKVTVFTEVEENPSFLHVERAAQWAQRYGIDLLVGLGGGSAIDCAKGCNLLYTNGGPVERFHGYGKATRPLLPLIALPTTAGTGTEAQSYAILAEPRSGRKLACGEPGLLPAVAILDPELTLTCPHPVTAAAGLDAIAHATESYVCLKRTVLSQLCGREAFRLLVRYFPVVLRDPAHGDARAALLWAAYLAGRAVEHSMLGAAHASANPLTAHFHLAHGLAVALMLPHVIRYNMPVAGPAYRELLAAGGASAATGPEEAGEVLAFMIEGFLRQAGFPTRLRDFGVPEGFWDELAPEAATQWTATFNPRPIDHGGFRQLYEQAW
jgi:alcohol dehydrogenase